MSHTTYRPDSDGLRAIAVLAVVLYHAHVPWITGGFIGVDVFFVISGFLITSLLLKDLRAERFSIAQFYERRIRRICPAFFTVMVCTHPRRAAALRCDHAGNAGHQRGGGHRIRIERVLRHAVWLFRCARRTESVTPYLVASD